MQSSVSVFLLFAKNIGMARDAKSYACCCSSANATDRNILLARLGASANVFGKQMSD